MSVHYKIYTLFYHSVSSYLKQHVYTCKYTYINMSALLFIGNWPVPPQEWLAAIAAATITTRQENGYISHDKEEPVPSTPPAPRPTPNTTSLEEVRGTESIRQKHTDPELCKVSYTIVLVLCYLAMYVVTILMIISLISFSL